MNKVLKFFPGNFSSNLIYFFFGVLSCVAAYITKDTDVTTSNFLLGIGTSLFIAGFVGVVSLKVLSEEVSNVTTQPLRDLNLLTQVKACGIIGIHDDRDVILRRICEEVEKEAREVVIIGSSLKGIIGVGENSTGRNEDVRRAIIQSLKRGRRLKVFVTHPAFAHHRSQQEGRSKGGIEAEIIKNLTYLLSIRKQYPDLLELKCYMGTPTIFAVATSEIMLINPYPYYSTAYSSPAQFLQYGSAMYRYYYKSHFQMAWDSQLAEAIKKDDSEAKIQISKFINGNNEKGEKMFDDSPTIKELEDYLNKVL